MADDVASITYCTDLSGKTVLLRASLNVPVENGAVLDTYRLRAAQKTIEYLKDQGARVVVIGHIGRKETDTLERVHKALNELTEIGWADELTGRKAEEQIKKLKNGEAVLLENLRSDPRETANDVSLAHELAAHADIYVNDAFAASHREHTSIVNLPKLLPSYAGLQFIEEIESLEKARAPKPPAVAFLGGAKFETKVPLIKNLLERYDLVFIGGALANDFFRAQGFEIGKSLTSDIDLEKEHLLGNENIYVPEQIAVENKVEKEASEVLPEETILDISPQGVREFQPSIQEAKTILWNGPMGNYEEGYVEGTEELAKIIAGVNAYTVVGGGDTVAAIESLDLYEKFDFVSTAGGAMLIFLEAGTLPGIEALKGAAYA